MGPSALHWDGQDLVIDVDEITTPVLGRMRGRIRLSPEGMTDREVVLDAEGRHIWRPFAPVARISVDLDRRGWTWDGHGYFDANFGTASLEEDFSYWTWARLPKGDGCVAFYDAERRKGGTLSAALAFAPDGAVREIEAPPLRPMSRNLWTVRRVCRADPGSTPRVSLPMLDAPFYSRACIEAEIDGERCRGVYEALDLNRFRSPLLKPMLALRVPRVWSR
ncbi:MAG: carotenoid 1,2-hydratase [Pseudomonadota bacterium]